jgi:hypothetical protein
MPTRRTDSFSARGDDGQDYIIDIYTDFVAAPTPEDPHAETAGFQSIRLHDGPRVFQNEKGIYRTWDGLILRSSAPNAP